MDRYVEQLRDSEDPSIAYRAHRRLDGAGEDDGDQRRRRRQVAETPNARRLLSSRRQDGTIRHGNEYYGYRSSKAPTGRWRHSRNLVIRPETRICCPSWTRFMGG
jgi:hypothetical protein